MGCGIAIIKYLVFIFNLVFAIIGMALLVVGVLFKLDIKQLKTFNETIGLAPTLLIAVGALIFIVSFFGCCGAIKESNCMLITYAVLLILILVLQVGIGIFSFMAIENSSEVKTDVRKDIKEMFEKYNATVNDKTEFDELQQLLKCCGVDGHSDFYDSIPPSCCLDNKEPCGKYDVDVFTVGCVEKAYSKIMLVVRSVGYVVFGICIAEIIGIMFAFCLTNSMRNHYRRGTYA